MAQWLCKELQCLLFCLTSSFHELILPTRDLALWNTPLIKTFSPFLPANPFLQDSCQCWWYTEERGHAPQPPGPAQLSPMSLHDRSHNFKAKDPLIS